MRQSRMLSRFDIFLGRCSLLLVLALLSVAHRASAADRAPIAVLASMRLDSHVEPVGSRWRFRGQVTDDLGVAIPDTQLKLPSLSFHSCSEPEPFLTVTKTDVRGEFCVEFDQAPAHLRVEVRAENHETYQGALELPRRGAQLVFVRAPSSVDLDSPSPELIELSHVLGAPEDEERRLSEPQGARIELGLRCGDQFRQLATQESRAGELSRFEVPAERFSPPGRCSLEATLESSTSRLSAHPTSLDVRGTVTLTLTNLSRQGSRLRVEFLATASGEDLSTGLVEARTPEGRFLATAEIQGGQGRFDWDLQDLPGAEPELTELQLNFHDAHPHYRAGPPLVISIPRPGEGLNHRVVHGLVLLLLFTWLGLAWVRRSPPHTLAAPVLPPGEAVVHVLEPSSGPLHGRVRDAHTSEPLELILVELLVPSATGEQLLASTQTDEEGKFTFAETTERLPLRRLRFSSRAHMSLETTNPGSALEVRLTERRRAGLTVFIQRMSQIDSAWFRRSPPTPGEVQRHSLAQNAHQRAEWAARIERVSFGPDAPSEQEVHELNAAEHPATSPSGR